MASVVEFPPRTSKNWTYEDYCRLDEDGRYEIFDGQLIPMQPPGASNEHQGGLGNLHVLLYHFVKSRKLGSVRMAPFDVIFDERNVVQPDLLFVAEKRRAIIHSSGVFGVPDLVMEFLSPSTSRKDRTLKKELYARFGVREYWLLDPVGLGIEVLALEEGQYVLHSAARRDGAVTSRLLEGFVVAVAECFEDW